MVERERYRLDGLHNAGVVSNRLRIHLAFPTQPIVDLEVGGHLPLILSVKSDLVHVEVGQQVSDVELVPHIDIVKEILTGRHGQVFQNRVDVCRAEAEAAELIETEVLKGGQVAVVASELESMTTVHDAEAVIDLVAGIVFDGWKKIARAEVADCIRS